MSPPPELHWQAKKGFDDPFAAVYVMVGALTVMGSARFWTLEATPLFVPFLPVTRKCTVVLISAPEAGA